MTQPSVSSIVEKLTEAQMLGPFFKVYADAGHWFDKPHGKCVNCGCPTINLFEDLAYGDVRKCQLLARGEGR